MFFFVLKHAKIFNFLYDFNERSDSTKTIREKESVAICLTYISPLGRPPSAVASAFALPRVHWLLFGITF